MARKKQTLNPMLITGVVIVGVVIFTLAGLNSGWLKTQLVTSYPMPTPNTAAIQPPQAALSITSVSPNQTTVGQTNPVPITVIGTGFADGCVIFINNNVPLNLTTTCNAAGDMATASIPTSQLASVATRTVKVRNPNGAISNGLPIAVVNPQPTITSINPASRRRTNTAFTMTINGSGFIAGSQVRARRPNGTTVTNNAPTIISPTQMRFSTTAPLVGQYRFTISNPAPGGGLSNQFIFTATP